MVGRRGACGEVFFDGDERAARDAAGVREGEREKGRVLFFFINADGCHGSGKEKNATNKTKKKPKLPKTKKCRNVAAVCWAAQRLADTALPPPVVNLPPHLLLLLLPVSFAWDALFAYI